MRDSSVASSARELSDVCQHQSGNFFPIARQAWLRFYQQTYLHVAPGKQYSGLFLLCSRHSGETPYSVTPRGSHAGGNWLTLNSESKELPLFVHPRQTLGCLDLHSQRETLPSQPAGNLGNWLILPQGTHGWAKLGFETNQDEGDVFPLWCSNRPWSIKALQSVQNICSSETLLDESGWSKQTETQDKPGHFWVLTDCELSQPPGFRVRGWCYSQATFEEGIDKRVLGQRAVWSKGHGNHAGQDETRVVTSFFALSVPWRSRPENKYMEIVKAFVVPLAPEAPGDNQCG